MSTILTPFPYYGGKSRMIDFIRDNAPRTNTFIDIFGGSGVVAINMHGIYKKVIYNDINSKMYNFFYAVRNHYPELIDAIDKTPASRKEYAECRYHSDDLVEDARRTLVRIRQGFSAKGVFDSLSSGWATPSNPNRDVAKEMKRSAVSLSLITNILKDYNLENITWEECVQKYANSDSTIFADPPYDLSVRTSKVYSHEFTNEDHIKLRNILEESPAKAMVCGYHSPLYDDLYKNWILKEKHVKCFAGTMKNLPKEKMQRIECLWIKK